MSKSGFAHSEKHSKENAQRVGVKIQSPYLISKPATIFLKAKADKQVQKISYLSVHAVIAAWEINILSSSGML